jgi:cellulose synthase/poly-beta-1,6-N-acetylglucosamine synthase-like glycosyltransferase
MGWPTTLAPFSVALTSAWVLFLIFDYRRKIHNASLVKSLGLLFHLIPALAFFCTSHLADTANNPANIWFWALLLFRYWRTAVNIFFWLRYKPAVTALGEKTKVSAQDVTVIVPTVGPYANNVSVFDEMVTAILMNRPAKVIFSANTETATADVMNAVPGYISAIAAGTTNYQRLHNLPAMLVTSEIEYVNAHVSNKRRQVVEAIARVSTPVVAMVDDTAIWAPEFLHATLPAFNDEGVGFVGTRKWVKRVRPVWDPEVSFFKNVWDYYYAGFWNTMGALYLTRHNFEIRATNAADGGVFCVSGRSSLIRTGIVADAEFTAAFLHEYFLRIPGYFNGFGPVKADDDNFLTRWVINHGWRIKIQASAASTMTTTLGGLPVKFTSQCVRWSRTTFRQNPYALLCDRTVWWDWPLTVWTTYLPWLYNAALIWDTLAIYTFTRTSYFSSWLHLTLLVLFI